jgi:hypothetical protein
MKEHSTKDCEYLSFDLNKVLTHWGEEAMTKIAKIIELLGSSELGNIASPLLTYFYVN